MPNIISQGIDPVSGALGIVASDGSKVNLTPSWVLQLLNGLAGSDPVLLHTTAQRLIASTISDALGHDQVSAAQITVDYDDTTGFFTDIEISN